MASRIPPDRFDPSAPLPYSSDRRTFLRFSLSGIAVSAAWALNGCGGGGKSPASNNPTRGTVSLRLIWPPRASTSSRYIPPYSESIVLTLSPKGQESDETKTRHLTLNRPDNTTSMPSPQTAEFKELPVGPYVLVGQAHSERDGQGSLLAQAQIEFEVHASETATPTLTLDSTIQSIEIQGQPLQVTEGDNLSLSGVAKDAQNNAILLPPGALTWSQVAGQAFGTLSAEGIFQATATGVARVRLAESQINVAAEADISVQPRIVPVTTGLAASAWPVIRGDEFYCRRVRNATGNATGVLKWEISQPEAISSILIGPGDILYYGGIDAIYARDSQTGNVIRTYSLPGAGKVSPETLGANGLLYATEAVPPYTLAIEIETGSVRWSTGPMRWTTALFSPFYLAPDDSFYIGGRILDAKTGALQPLYRGAYPDASSIIVKDRTVYLTGQYQATNTILACDSPRGSASLLWVAEQNFYGFGSLGIALGPNGFLYGLGSAGGEIINPFYALDSATGRRVWATSCRASGYAIGSDGTVYISAVNLSDSTGTKTPGVFALDGQTGKIKWQFPNGSTPGSGIPVIGRDGTVYVGMARQGSNQVLALDANTGLAKWVLNVPTGDSPSPPGTLSIGSDGTLYYAYMFDTGNNFKLLAIG